MNQVPIEDFGELIKNYYKNSKIKNMNIERDYWLYHVLIGLIYWAYNLIFRKLHTKNEPGEGWFLTPFWLLGWPLCFLMLIAGWIEYKITHKKHTHYKY